jgi:CRISPR-associated endonuclease/helicase Cas3
VHIFIPPKPAPPGLLRKGEDKTRELLTIPNIDLQHPKTFCHYFEMFYSALNDTGKDWLEDRLNRDANPNLEFHFRTAGREFQLVKEQGQAVFVQYGKNKKWLDQLNAIGPTRENLRALQQYSVTISKFNFERARTGGLVQDLWQEKFWCWTPTYNRSIGVDIFGNGWSPDDLIV